MGVSRNIKDMLINNSQNKRLPNISLNMPNVKSGAKGNLNIGS